MNRLITLSLFAALAGPATIRGADAQFKAVAPWLDEQVFAVGRVDLTRLDPDALLAKLGAAAKMDEEDLARAKRDINGALGKLTRAGCWQIYVVLSLADLTREPPAVLVVPLAKNMDAREVVRAWQQLRPPSEVEQMGKAVVIAPAPTLERLRRLQPVARPDLARAFAATGDAPVQVAVALPEHLRLALEELMPTLPEQVGGGSSKAVLRSFSWAALAVELAPKLSLRLTVQTPDAAAAEELARLTDNVAKVLREAGRKNESTSQEFDRIITLLTPRASEDRLTLTLKEKDQIEVLLPMLARMRGTVHRAQMVNDLKQIGLALHYYHDTKKIFPAAASHDKQGRPLLSWRVHLLPFLNEGKLHNQFRLDEPWDSEHNKKLIALLPAVYRSRNSKTADAGKTVYLAPVGKDTMFPGRKGVRFADVTDGLSYTIFLVEVADEHAVIWTKPEDWPYDPQQPRRGLAGGPQGHFAALFVDGSVHILPGNIALDTLRALFTRNGGEVIQAIP